MITWLEALNKYKKCGTNEIESLVDTKYMEIETSCFEELAEEGFVFVRSLRGMQNGYYTWEEIKKDPEYKKALKSIIKSI